MLKIICVQPLRFQLYPVHENKTNCTLGPYIAKILVDTMCVC